MLATVKKNGLIEYNMIDFFCPMFRLINLICNIIVLYMAYRYIRVR